MITKDLIKKLRHAPRGDLSVNAELTKTRFREDYYSSTNTQKNDAILLSDSSEASFKNAANKGRITIKPLVAFSFMVQVSPFWYTGEAEEKEPYTDELMWEFFCKHDYLYLVRSFKPDSIADPELTAKEIASKNAIEQELDFDTAVKLLEALYIQAEYSDKAEDALKEVRTILLSR